MDRIEKLTGGQVLAIPHNGNLSNGLMYTAETYDHKPMDAAYAEARISHEPVMEVTQVKGDGETHPFLSPNDENLPTSNGGLTVAILRRPRRRNRIGCTNTSMHVPRSNLD